jgi:hypothetical protein
METPTNTRRILPESMAGNQLDGRDFRAVAGDVIREIIRRDPALWAQVQGDAALRREFGFADDG